MSEKGMLGKAGGAALVGAVALAGAVGYFLLSGRTGPTLEVPAPQDLAAVRAPATDATPPGHEEQPMAAAEPPAAVPDDAAADTGAAAEAEETTPTQEQSEEAETPVGPTVELPRFGDVRLDASGLAVVAGTAPAGFEVLVREGAAELARTTANAAGDFATIFDLVPTGEARVLYLVALGPDGIEHRSEQSAILTPPLAPAPEETVAEAEPAADTTPERAAEQASPEPAAEEVATLEPEPEPEAADVTAVEPKAEPVSPEPETEEVAALAPEPESPVAVTRDGFGAAGGAPPQGVADDSAAQETVGLAAARPEVPAMPEDAPEPAPPAVERPAPAESGGEPEEQPQDSATGQVAETTDVAPETEPAPAGEAPVPGRDPAGAETPVAGAETELTAERPAEAPSGTALSDQHEAESAGRVPARELPAGDAIPTILLADRTGIELLRPSPAAAERLADTVVIDVISYSEDGSVSLAGRAAAAMERADRVRVYLNNRPVQTAKISPDGSWRIRLPAVKPGIYTLRVDQVDPAGVVVARFETPFKREDPNEIARMAPSDLATGGVAASVITVQPGYTLWGIATDRYGSGYEYWHIFRANRGQIRDPDLIYPGQVFELPDTPATPE